MWGKKLLPVSNECSCRDNEMQAGAVTDQSRTAVFYQAVCIKITEIVQTTSIVFLD